jgi:LmbE family N-acetylglucosaminyl deacetylase
MNSLDIGMRLPVPDADGVYTYPTTLLAAHHTRQEHLSALRERGAADVVELTAPLTGASYLIERRLPRGRPVLAIEPHHDDLILSASGMLLSHPAPLIVVTVFTRSATVDPSLAGAHLDVDQVSALRAAEAQVSLVPFDAVRHPLGHKDADRPYRPYDRDVLEAVVEQLRPIVVKHRDALLLAPAAVTRHPDHLLVHEAARRLGCTWFWEDVAFWATYALGSDDQHLFRARTRGTLADETIDITNVILDKLTLLHLHASQIQPLSAMHRPVRYAWTAADPLRRDGESGALYAENFYRTCGGER